MSLRGSRAALVLGALLLLSVGLAGAARADCQPAVPASGGTVTCSGSVPAGFASGVGQLTINILAGAVINDNGTAGLTLGERSIVNNFGSIVTGAGTTGIFSFGGSFNVINNFNSIVTGDNGTTVTLISRNTLANSGSITVGAGASLLVSGDFDNVIVNTGTMTTSGGGIFVASRNAIVNSGMMTVIGGGTLISFVSDNSFTNTGTMNVDCCGVGVLGSNRNVITNNGNIILGFNAIAFQVGNDNTIVNNGSIVGADGAVAMILGGDNSVTNNGLIVLGANGIAIQAGSPGNTITNNGSISVGDSGFALQAVDNTTFVNNGTITVGPNGAGLFVFDNSTITNNGTIRVGALAVAIFSPSSTNIVVTNNGTIDGGMLLGACGCSGTNVLNNNGLLTITDPAMPVGVANFTVGGTFNQSATGTFAPRVTPVANATDPIATDVANLNGTLNVVVTSGDYAATTSYAVLTATTSITGTFAQVTTSAFFDIAATYNANDVTVTLTRLGFANGRGATINQRHIGAALDAQYVPGLTGNAATIFNAVQSSTTTSVLDALSGEAAAAAQNGNFAVGNQFLALMLRQAGLARGGASGGGSAQSHDGQRVLLASAATMADASPAQARGGAPGTWSMWMAGFGGHASRNGDSVVGSARQSIGFAGVATGVDYRVSPSLLIGAAAAASGSGYTVADRAAEGDARNFHFGVYGGFSSGPVYVDGALSYAYGDFTNTRTIALGAPEQSNGAYSGHQFGGRLEAGWRVKASRYEITPFGAVAVQTLRQTGYSENTRVIATGAPGILGLNVAGQRSWSVRSELGGQINTSFALDDGTTIKPRLRLAWAHEFSADRQVTASLQSLPAASFTVNGARAARDAAIVTAGVDFGLSSNVTGFAQFDGEFSLSGSSFAGAGGLRVTW